MARDKTAQGLKRVVTGKLTDIVKPFPLPYFVNLEYHVSKTCTRSVKTLVWHPNLFWRSADVKKNVLNINKH